MQTTPDVHVGAVFEIVRVTETARQSGNSSATSRDSDMLVERVVAVSGEGIELEYDLPANASARNRAGAWQFPARVLRSREGRITLRNEPDLKARVADWLAANKIARTQCGHWIFTWNAFRIECDPQSVIPMIEAVDLGHDPLAEGQPYRDRQARSPAPLKRKQGGTGFSVELAIDADAVRRDRVENDMVVGELSQKPVTRAEALRQHAGETISGTIRIAFDTDAAGYALRKTKVTTVTIARPGGATETSRITEVLERRPVRRASDPNTI
ncbi:hypothetical protein AB2M62_12545 [Sphingomonas sp. MMS12-HWE2-04]|uniref:hypothetical protein n=1 Tax=Sphingomonas sp. MMS12-HWE2-04 TaxID=3234199 RepID=UPI00384EE869